MAKPWAKLGEGDRAKVIEVLNGALRAFADKKDRGGVAAVNAALERLHQKKASPARREAHYGPTDLGHRLGAESTRSAAIAEMVAAVRNHKGVEHAHKD